MKRAPRDLRKEILALLATRDYRPLDTSEMARKLKLAGHDRVLLRQTLRQLEHSGHIARIRKDRYVLPSEADLVTGTLSINQGGFAFLDTEAPGQSNVFITAENTGTAMHGDRVVARISREVRPRRGKSNLPEGRVIRILERVRNTVVGTLQQSRNFHYVVPDDPRFVHNVYVQIPPLTKLPKPPALGDKVVVRLEPWESRHVNPEGDITEALGPASAPGVDVLSIVRKYDLPTEFPGAVLDEVSGIPGTVDAAAAAGREDLRNQFIVTVDPDDARDFDDAINVEKIDGQGWQLGVHIADVAAYVTPGTALDREARKRGNSVYLPDRVIPMLPEQLSNGVCSLKPNVDRLTHSVFIQFDKNGRTRNLRFARSVIRSAHRLTYKQAYALLKSPPRDELGRRLHGAWELAALLRRKRFEHGSLDLDFPEVKVHVDANGKPVKMERIENDESHQLIEEFMLAANEAVATEMRHRQVPTVYRVHEDPDPEKLAEYRELVLSHGYKVGDLKQRKELQRFLASLRGKAEEQTLKIGLLKSLKRARYTTQPLGHYGLAKSNYLHFTSPIRRYADLVVHRGLAERNEKHRSGTDLGQLTSLAEHISITERNAAEAEIDAVRMKKMEFFQMQLDRRDPQVFRAAIVDVRNYGLVVELPDILTTGLIHVSSLDDDFYLFEPAQHRLIGRRSRRKFAVGDEVQVFVARVDPFKRQIDFALADKSKSSPRGRAR